MTVTVRKGKVFCMCLSTGFWTQTSKVKKAIRTIQQEVHGLWIQKGLFIFLYRHPAKNIFRYQGWTIRKTINMSFSFITILHRLIKKHGTSKYQPTSSEAHYLKLGLISMCLSMQCELLFLTRVKCSKIMIIISPPLIQMDICWHSSQVSPS